MRPAFWVVSFSGRLWSVPSPFAVGVVVELFGCAGERGRQGALGAEHTDQIPVARPGRPRVELLVGAVPGRSRSLLMISPRSSLTS